MGWRLLVGSLTSWAFLGKEPYFCRVLLRKKGGNSRRILISTLGFVLKRALRLWASFVEETCGFALAYYQRTLPRIGPFFREVLIW